MASPFVMVFENPWLCRGFHRASSVGSKKASLHGKIRLVSRPPNLIHEGGMSHAGQE